VPIRPGRYKKIGNRFCLLSPLSRDPEMDDIPEALEKHRELYEKAKEIEQRLTEEISVIY